MRVRLDLKDRVTYWDAVGGEGSGGGEETEFLRTKAQERSAKNQLPVTQEKNDDSENLTGLLSSEILTYFRSVRSWLNRWFVQFTCVDIDHVPRVSCL